MTTNMKTDWGNQIFEAMQATHTAMINCSAYWMDRRKIELLDKVAMSDGILLNSDYPPTHEVKSIKCNTVGTKACIELVNLVDGTDYILNI